MPVDVADTQLIVDQTECFVGGLFFCSQDVGAEVPVHDSNPAIIWQDFASAAPVQRVNGIKSIGKNGYPCDGDKITAVTEAIAP